MGKHKLLGTTNKTTTQAYRHGRCHMCGKPVSTTNMNPDQELICSEYQQDKNGKDKPDKVNTKRGLQKKLIKMMKKNGEESQSLSQSNDSDEDTWLDELGKSDSEQQRRNRVA
jgi:hypothetical protein